MPRRIPKNLQKFLIVLAAILVVALPIGMFVLFPSGVVWTWFLEISAVAQRYVAMLLAFPAWLFKG